MKAIFHSNSQQSRIRTPNRARNVVLYTVGVLFSLLCLLATPAMAERNTDFDHFTTGFPLSGAHNRVECEDCHQRGVFQGTPKQCNACHNGRTATSKGAKHIQSGDTCDDCHTAFSWDTRAVDHSSVIGVCTACHQLPIRHLATGSTCDNCHNTLSWNSTGFDHVDITQPCASCHNGTDARGITNNHIPTTAACDDCHSTRTFSPAKVDHSSLTAACATCHNNSVTPGKSPSHVQSSETCDDCHNTRTWDGAKFDHGGVVPGTCRNCHDKPAGHLQSSDLCDDCHTTKNWNANFEHTPGSNCFGCHNGNPIIGKSNSHIASTNDCEVCHTNFISFNNVVMTSAKHNDVLGTCSGCHQKDLPSTHWPVTTDCGDCHRTSRWTSVPTYSHNNANYPGRHKSSVTCIKCHRMNGSSFEPASRWNAPYNPFCAGCHANKFDRGERKHRRDGAGNRTVEANKGCGDSGCHRVSAGGW